MRYGTIQQGINTAPHKTYAESESADVAKMKKELPQKVSDNLIYYDINFDEEELKFTYYYHYIKNFSDIEKDFFKDNEYFQAIDTQMICRNIITQYRNTGYPLAFYRGGFDFVYSDSEKNELYRVHVDYNVCTKSLQQSNKLKKN